MGIAHDIGRFRAQQMSLDPRIARTDNHHIRFQLIGRAIT